MHRIPRSLSRRLLVVAGAFALATLAVAPFNYVGADFDDYPVVRVEEDWSLMVNQPASNVASPQVSTQMARAPYSSRFGNLHINARDIPTFAQGGLQLQTWKDSVNHDVATSTNTPVLSTANELITWTQYLRVSSGQLKFGISAASSTTFGNFSGIEVTFASGLPYLEDYSADHSQHRSGVTFGANRVQSLVMVATRKYNSIGQVQTDMTPRVIFSRAMDANPPPNP